MKTRILSIAACLLATTLMLSAVTVLRQDFEATLPGLNGHDFKLVVPDGPGQEIGQALQISRVAQEGARMAVSGNGEQLNQDRDTTLRITLRPGATGKCFFGLAARNSKLDKQVFQLLFQEDNIVGIVADGKSYFLCRSVPQAWQTYEITVHPGAEMLDAWRIDADGSRNPTVPAPMENNIPFDEIVLFTMPGLQEAALVDCIEISQGDLLPITGRENVALSASDSTAVIQDANGERDGSRLIDGDTSAGSNAQLDGLPSTVLVSFAEARSISTVRIHSGIAEYMAYPSADLSVTACRIEGFSSASGQWRELVASNEGAPAAGSADEDDTARSWQLDFEPIEVKALRVTVLESSDSGKRADGPAAMRSATIREIEAFSKDFGGASEGLGNVLQAEFRLQVYRDQETANIHAILAEGTPPFEVEVSFRERWTNRIPAEPFRFLLKPGENIIPVDIRGWENGEYRTQLRAAGKDSPVRGEFARLLRIDHVPPAIPPEAFGDLSGQRLFFPDDWYLAQHQGLRFGFFPPEVHFVPYQRFCGDKSYVNLGSDMYFTDDGKLVMSFSEFDHKWVRVGGVHYVSCTPGEWKWELLPGKPENIVATNNAEMVPYQCRAEIGAAGLPGGSLEMEGTFRFYDPEKDGPVDLSQVRVQYVGYKPLDWGVVKVPPQSTWLIWTKGDENILLWDHYFLKDNLGGGEFEELTDTNDNHAGQWLSDDGKTLCFVRGHLLKRYPPFIARYDNIWQGSRMLTIFSTKDGINWERHYMAQPDESDPPNSQHYGACMYRAPRGHGLVVAFTQPYRAMDQQYDIELAWSWDGMDWKRFPGHKSWLPAAELDGINFGYADMHGNALEKDGLIYHEIGSVSSMPHFSYEYVDADFFGKATGEDLRKLYEKRGVAENWRYWKQYGSWDAMAKAWNKHVSHTGLTVYRKGGLFGITVGPEGGSFTTRPMSARGKMTANIKVLPGGHARFRLLDRQGKEIAARELDGDGIALPLFETLPDGLFRIEAELADAELYTLNFE